MSIIKQVCVFLIVCAVFTNVSSAPRVQKTVTTGGDEDTEIKTITSTKTKKNGDVVSKTTSTVIEKGDDLKSKKDDVFIKTVSKNVVSTSDSGDIVTTGVSKTMAKSGSDADNKIVGVSTDAVTAVTGDAQATANTTANMKTTGKGAAKVKGITTTETIVKPGTDSTAIATGGTTPILSSSEP